MKTIEYRDVIDKAGWGDGPWQTEPDKKQWQDQATGLPCIARRTFDNGNWCGYVGVPPGHQLHGKGYDDLDVSVHGGLTFAGDCREGEQNNSICHVPESGEPDRVWWFGFDCHHCFDIAPGHEAIMKKYRMPPPPRDLEEQYRDLSYVEAQCTALAAQLAAMPLNQPPPSPHH